MTDKRWNEYIQIKEGIAKREAQLQAEHEELLVLQQGTEQKHQSVEQLLSAKSAELQKYENQITVAQDQISEYEKDLKAQEDKIRQMEAEIKRKEEEAKKAAEAAGKQYNTPSIGNIKFIWPCPASKRITSSFGGRSSPTEGASSNHQGMDIGAPTGTDIVSGSSGRGYHIYIQLFCGKLSDDQSWRRRLYGLYALFPTAGISRRNGQPGAGHCKGGFDWCIDRATSTFWNPCQRKLCRSGRVCKSVGYTRGD